MESLLGKLLALVRVILFLLTLPFRTAFRASELWLMSERWCALWHRFIRRPVAVLVHNALVPPMLVLVLVMPLAPKMFLRSVDAAQLLFAELTSAWPTWTLTTPGTARLWVIAIAWDAAGLAAAYLDQCGADPASTPSRGALHARAHDAGIGCAEEEEEKGRPVFRPK